MEDLVYSNLKLSEYMKSPLLSCRSAEMLLALRTRTVRGVKNDFRGMYPDVSCPLECGDIDTLSNILTCPVLQANMTSTNIASSTIQYSDVYSSDIAKQKQVTEAYMQLLELRERLLNACQ